MSHGKEIGEFTLKIVMDFMTGNYKEFLEEYNGKENLTGLYRLMDPVYTDSKSITGVKLDFIW